MRKQPASTETPKAGQEISQKREVPRARKKRELDKMVTRLMKGNSRCLHKSCSRQRPPPPFREKGSVSPELGAAEAGVLLSAGTVKQPTHQADSYFFGGA